MSCKTHFTTVIEGIQSFDFLVPSEKILSELISVNKAHLSMLTGQRTSKHKGSTQILKIPLLDSLNLQFTSMVLGFYETQSSTKHLQLFRGVENSTLLTSSYVVIQFLNLCAPLSLPFLHLLSFFKKYRFALFRPQLQSHYHH